MTPPLLAIFFTGMSVMEMVDDPLEECRNKFLPTFARSCLFWLPAQTVNFLFVPPPLRVTYIGTCSLIWANILCFMKRQKTDADDDKKEKWTTLYIVNFFDISHVLSMQCTINFDWRLFIIFTLSVGSAHLLLAQLDLMNLSDNRSRELLRHLHNLFNLIRNPGFSFEK